jgi:hypothetical protein
MDFEPIKTSDTPFAAYLHYKGHHLVTIINDPNDIKRKVFVFVREETTPEVEQLFYKEGAPAEAPKYYKSIRIIYKELRESNENKSTLAG